MSNEPSKEAFDEWRQGPVGEWFFGELESVELPNIRDQWTSESFDGGNNNQRRLDYLRGMYTTVWQVIGLSYDDMTEVDDE